MIEHTKVYTSRSCIRGQERVSEHVVDSMMCWPKALQQSFIATTQQFMSDHRMSENVALITAYTFRAHTSMYIQ